jgi:hypothetical protein
VVLSHRCAAAGCSLACAEQGGGARGQAPVPPGDGAATARYWRSARPADQGTTSRPKPPGVPDPR